MTQLHELDVVHLSTAHPEAGLDRGAVGTVVYLYESADAAEVEFLNPSGQTAAVLTIDLSDLEAAPSNRAGRFSEARRSNVRSRFVYSRPNGNWVNKRAYGNKASSVHSTKDEAVSAARNMLVNQGGGEVVVKGRTGKIARRKVQARRRNR